MIPSVLFTILNILVSALNIFIAVKVFLKRDKKGVWLGFAAICSIVVSTSYTISAFMKDYRLQSIFSSIYFITIDMTLLFLLCFCEGIQNNTFTKRFKILGLFLKLFILYEIIVFSINPFIEIAVSYTYRKVSFAMYTYDMKPLYIVHLVFTYALVIGIVANLLIKAFSVPKEYRAKYTYIIYGIAVIVALNAIFLFIPKSSEWFMPDYSVLFYVIGVAVCYWTTYYFTENGLLIHFKDYVFENIDQGMVLFDYEGHVILTNNKAINFLQHASLTSDTTLDEFLSRCDLNLNMNDSACSVQCYTTEYGKQKPLRCDYRLLKNKKDQIIGRLFVFADAQLDTDLLTDFHNWESFTKFALDNSKTFPNPTTVAVCDINRLTVYNTVHGRNAGDMQLKKLADLLRTVFPDAYYVRGNDAHLIVICYSKAEPEVFRAMTEIKNTFELTMQFAVATTSPLDKTILDTISTAVSGLKAKKLMDKDSTKSAVIASLVKALQECDPDTEAHVERTQKMGAELGKRIGLSDIAQSKLSLLCLLHDIGKIGIPLEVLNKPGKLNEEEWLLIKSHVIKGEAIAQSSPELAGISEYIRLHHERWDGKGYPDGLTKESIPLLSRIISIVDAFDAMVNNRSYRKAKTIDEAKAEIVACSGTQFDPVIASEFIAMLDDGYQITQNEEHVVIPVIESKETLEERRDRSFVHPIYYAKYILSPTDQIIAIDPVFTQITGYTEEDIRTKEIYQMDLLPKDDRTEYMCAVTEQMANKPIAYIEHRILCKNGTIKYVYCLGKKYFDSVARTEKIEIIIVNSSTTHNAKILGNQLEKKAQKQRKQWEDTYRRDSLTGLLSHMAFISDVEQRHAANPARPYMFIMIDLDNFKKFNDSYGHLAGDEFLILIAQAIQDSIRESDLACRMGGDEFMVACYYHKNESYTEIAKQIFNKIAYKLSCLEHSTTFSMGVAVKSETLNSFNDIYKAADTVLYLSKNQGRNRVSFYEETKSE